MEYKELCPASQEEQLDLGKELFSALKFAMLKLLTIFAAGMGSGKSRIIEILPRLMGNTITYVLTPNEQLQRQLMQVFVRQNDLVYRVPGHGRLTLIDGKHPRAAEQIRNSRRGNLPVVVFLSCLKKKDEVRMNATTDLFLGFLKAFKDQQQLVLIDELDLHLTELTGGINAKVSHHDGIMKVLRSIFEYQIDRSMNVFDAIREANAKVVAFSGTFNNFVCSKLPSLGYQKEDICLVNVKPIPSLYWAGGDIPKLTIIPAETVVKHGKKSVPNRVILAEFFQKVEASPGKGLIACSTKKQIDSVKRAYAEQYGRSISSAEITGESKPENDVIKAVKYIIGMKLVGTGLDLSTLAEGCEFSHGILLSFLSDKESNPLSKNLEHFLHNEVSASFLQLIARLRKGGTFTVPSAFRTVTSLGDALEKVHTIIREGRAQMDIVGPILGNQRGRHAQGTLLAIIQNLRHDMLNMNAEERPVVEEILNDLLSFDGRDLRAEYRASMEDAAFDHDYWIQTVGLLWSVFYERWQKGMNRETFEAAKPAMIAAAKARGLGAAVRGNGLRSGREIDERVTEEVIARAGGICCHCGDPVSPGTGQVCHFDRFDQGGSYTADNLMYGHIACDSNFDQNNIICVPSGGTYRKKKQCGGYDPDIKQWAAISAENKEKRWKWVMRTMGYATSEELVAGLREKGYTFYGE